MEHIRLCNGRIRDLACSTYDEALEIRRGIDAHIDIHGCLSVLDLADMMGYRADMNDQFVGWKREDLEDESIVNSHFNSDGELGAYIRMPASKYIGSREHARPNPTANPVAKEAVNHPDHYQAETGMEVIDVMEAFTFDLKGIEAVDTSNVIKYICRWKKKNGLQDLKKARWYLEHLINHVEKLEKENEYNG